MISFQHSKALLQNKCTYNIYLGGSFTLQKDTLSLSLTTRSGVQELKKMGWGLSLYQHNRCKFELSGQTRRYVSLPQPKKTCDQSCVKNKMCSLKFPLSLPKYFVQYHLTIYHPKDCIARLEQGSATAAIRSNPARSLFL